MQTAASFMSDFIHDPLKKLGKEEELHAALQGLVGLSNANLHEEVVRKLIAALRKKNCSIETPRKRDPFEVLMNWVAKPLTGDSSSETANSSHQEPGQDLSLPKGGKRKSGRKKQPKKSSAEEALPSSKQGGGPNSVPILPSIPPVVPSTVGEKSDQVPESNNHDSQRGGVGSSSGGSNNPKGVAFDQTSYVAFLGAI